MENKNLHQEEQNVSSHGGGPRVSRRTRDPRFDSCCYSDLFHERLPLVLTCSVSDHPGEELRENNNLITNAAVQQCSSAAVQ